MMFFSWSWIKKSATVVLIMNQKLKKKQIPQMDDIQQKLFPLLSFIWNLDKLDKRMWHPDMKLPHIRKTHPYFSVCSFKMGGDTAFSPHLWPETWSHDRSGSSDIRTVCLFLSRKTHTAPRIVCTLNTTNKDDPCLLPIYTHFLFFCFYWVCTFHTGLF